MTRFTPEQLAGVYASRWAARDMANRFIRQLNTECVAILRSTPIPPVDRRLAGRQIQIRVPQRGATP